MSGLVAFIVVDVVVVTFIAAAMIDSRRDAAKRPPGPSEPPLVGRWRRLIARLQTLWKRR